MVAGLRCRHVNCIAGFIDQARKFYTLPYRKVFSNITINNLFDVSGITYTLNHRMV